MENNNEICRYIQNNISKLCQTEIDEIFKILHKNNSTYTQNNNGVFVNLNWIDADILKQIYDYISFCLKSQTEINKYEIMKNMINDSMTTKERIDDKLSTVANNSNITNSCVKQQKVSSSMKFYLLKKRYLKRNTVTGNNINNVLNHEEYVM